MITRISDGALRLIDRVRRLGREVGALPLLAVAVAVLAAGGGAAWLLSRDGESDRTGAAQSQPKPFLPGQSPQAETGRKRPEENARQGKKRHGGRADRSSKERDARVPGKPDGTRTRGDAGRQGEAESLLDAVAGDGGGRSEAGGDSDAPTLLEAVDEEPEEQPDDTGPSLLDPDR